MAVLPTPGSPMSTGCSWSCGKDADGAPDLGVAADDGVDLALARLRNEIDAVFLERIVGGLRIVRGDALAAAHGRQLLEHLGGRG